ncbi:MAG: TIGR04282 family arsenosugar biosynthesis glycosyltransferase [Pirellulales bacterium]|nr:TIGR04282 family arsenosugar biosynthesis glycosyltransferase [Pirellulales bacterium]
MSRLGIFAKYWQAGEVKTRLATAIGAREAAEIYHAFLTTILRRFSDLPLSDLPLNRVVAYSPTDRRAEFAQLVDEPWELRPQVDGDLGSRMRDFFDASFDAGCDLVVLIGSDSPTLPASRITEAFNALRKCSVVLGPSEDGGYYLVGARQQTPDIFDDIDWGTPNVMRQTLDRLRGRSASYQEIAPWYDVDDAASFDRLQKELVQCEDDDALKELRVRIEAAREIDRG